MKDKKKKSSTKMKNGEIYLRTSVVLRGAAALIWEKIHPRARSFVVNKLLLQAAKDPRFAVFFSTKREDQGKTDNVEGKDEVQGKDEKKIDFLSELEEKFSLPEWEN